MINSLSYARSLAQKKLCIGYIPRAGRNFSGRICVHHRGGGSKRRFQFVDLYRRINSFGKIISMQKTAFRSAYIGLIMYKNGLSSYIVLTHGNTIGDFVYSGSILPSLWSRTNGLTIPISYMNLFCIVSALEIKPFIGIKMMRSAGMSAMISGKIIDRTSIKLANGMYVSLSNWCICTFGVVSNPHHNVFNYRKAGYIRALGIRPTVRGVAMNPCDHPHGGGEGKKSPPVAARSPWGWLTKAGPTVKRKNTCVGETKVLKLRS